MAFALLHVLLQPRLTPRSDVKPASRSMYPLWGVDQRNFPMLFAAGGEAGQAEIVMGRVISEEPGSNQQGSVDTTAVGAGGVAASTGLLAGFAYVAWVHHPVAGNQDAYHKNGSDVA